MEEIETTTSINLKLESSETLETTEKAEITTFINDKLTISKPKLLNLKRMKPKELGTQQIHQEDIKGLLTNVAIQQVVEFSSGGYKIRKIFA